MSKPEEIGLSPAQTDDAANARLYEGAYLQRVADQGSPFIQINAENPQPHLQQAPIVAPTRVAETQWRTPVHPTTLWPGPSASQFPPNGVQWNGRKPDISRGPGGTIIQQRPPFVGAEPPIVSRPSGPQVAPGAIEATRPQGPLPTDPQGRIVGPTIIPGGEFPHRPAERPITPADPGRQGGLIDRNGDGKLEDERSEKDKGLAAFDLLGFVGGGLIGLKRGGLKGAAAGAIIGLIASQVVKPLNPFK